MKNLNTNNSTPLEPLRLDYQFSYKKLVIINKSLETLISNCAGNNNEVVISENDFSVLFDFKDSLCDSITGFILNPLPENEPYLSIKNKEVISHE